MHPFVVFFRSHALARLAFVLFGVATGCGIIYLSWYNASRAALGVGSLDDARIEDLGRRQVLCSHPTWHCEAAVHDDKNGFVVPFDCGRATGLLAGFPGVQTKCDAHRSTVGGFFMDLNEAGGGSPQWIVRVDSPASTFPDVLTFMGVAILLLALTFPSLLGWLEARAQRRT